MRFYTSLFRNSIFLYCFIESNNHIDNKLISGFAGGLGGSILSHPQITIKHLFRVKHLLLEIVGIMYLKELQQV